MWTRTPRRSEELVATDHGERAVVVPARVVVRARLGQAVPREQRPRWGRGTRTEAGSEISGTDSPAQRCGSAPAPRREPPADRASAGAPRGAARGEAAPAARRDLGTRPAPPETSVRADSIESSALGAWPEIGAGRRARQRRQRRERHRPPLQRRIPREQRARLPARDRPEPHGRVGQLGQQAVQRVPRAHAPSGYLSAGCLASAFTISASRRGWIPGAQLLGAGTGAWMWRVAV